MQYKIVEYNIGRAGNKIQMERKKNDWDNKYGKNKWITGYEINKKFITRNEAIKNVYNAAYFNFLDKHPKIVEMIIKYSGCFNPHAYFTNSSDIQAKVIEQYLKAHNLQFKNDINKKLAIGIWQPHNIMKYKSKIADMNYTIYNGKIQYDSISLLLSPFRIKTLHDPNLSVEEFWQSFAKCLAIII